MLRPAHLLLAIGLSVLAVGGRGAGSATTANDPVFTQGLQWPLTRIGAPAAWSKGTGRGITIAVVDSGADLQHEDLKDKIVSQISCIDANGDATKCTGSAQDDNGHGTHVAGIAAATTNNNRGIAGVAPDAELLIVRALVNDCSVTPCSASGTSGDVSAGIRWAVDHGAGVINLSLGGGTAQSALGCSFCDAIDYAWSKGVIAVVAAGNDSDLPSGFSNEPAVVVTATTRDDLKASYSNTSSGILRSARWPVAAPGGEAETQPSDCATGGTPKGVVSTYWISAHPNQYACLAGTSMAAPHVSGALAVLLSVGYAPQAAIDRLLSTATDLGAPGRDDVYGYGRIDLAAAAGSTTPTTGSTTSSAPTGTRTTSSTRTARSGSTVTTSPTASSIDTAPTGPDSPIITTPQTSAAAPFSAQPASQDPSAWLVGVAIAALGLSGLGTALTASGLLRADRRAAGPRSVTEGT